MKKWKCSSAGGGWHAQGDLGWSWNLNVGSLAPALGLSPIGVLLLPWRASTQPGRGRVPDTTQARGWCPSDCRTRKLQACHAFVMLLVPVEEMRLCGFLGGECMNSWQKKGTSKRRFVSRGAFHLAQIIPPFTQCGCVPANLRANYKSFW